MSWDLEPRAVSDVLAAKARRRMASKEPVKLLTYAAAFIAAEIDRIKRLEKPAL